MPKYDLQNVLIIKALVIITDWAKKSSLLVEHLHEIS